MSHDEFEIPTRLADDLANLSDARVFVPAERDEAILTQARQTLTAPARSASADGTHEHRSRWKIPAVTASLTTAIAAALLVGVVLWTVTSLDSPSRSEAPSIAADIASETTPPAPTDDAVPSADIDHSGRVDIIDALILAKQAERADAPDLRFDFTGDGHVNREDAEHIARRAVALNTGDAG